MCAIPRIHTFKPTVTQYEKRLKKRMEKRGIPFEAQKRVYTKSGRRYLVDFLIPPKLVVEVGYISAEDMQEDQDLRDSGYTVLRYRNKEITRGVGVVCLEIEGERRRLSQQQGQRP